VAQSSIAKARDFTAMVRTAAAEASCEDVKPLLSSLSAELSAEAEIAISCVHVFHSFVPSVSNRRRKVDEGAVVKKGISPR
jgi:hypothetical protein